MYYSLTVCSLLLWFFPDTSLYSYEFFLSFAEKLPMETLDCFSDYVSHTACTWNESRDARNFVKMKLLHSDIYQ
uniref:Cytokine receptor common subunit beta N-terminal domain-containing protein n=1 Tax=Podarcis muralis TaxID=64176 RepID=A0A670IU45_PODMU